MTKRIFSLPGGGGGGGRGRGELEERKSRAPPEDDNEKMRFIWLITCSEDDNQKMWFIRLITCLEDDNQKMWFIRLITCLSDYTGCDGSQVIRRYVSSKSCESQNRILLKGCLPAFVFLKKSKWTSGHLHETITMLNAKLHHPPHPPPTPFSCTNKGLFV